MSPMRYLLILFPSPAETQEILLFLLLSFTTKTIWNLLNIGAPISLLFGPYSFDGGISFPINELKVDQRF